MNNEIKKEWKNPSISELNIFETKEDIDFWNHTDTYDKDSSSNPSKDHGNNRKYGNGGNKFW